MPVQNFTGDAAHEAYIRGLLFADEELRVIATSERRTITVTSQRILLHERDGDLSTTRTRSIDVVEQSSIPPKHYLKFHAGAGSRTIDLVDAAQSMAVTDAIFRP